MEIKLRDYQQECIDTLDRKGSGKFLVQLPTGAGKTVVFSHLKRRGKMLILSHREELVKQPLKYFGCTTSVERAGEHADHSAEVISASVQSLQRRLDQYRPDEFDIIVVDECHHSSSDTYRKIINYFSPRQLIGFTATPNRSDGVRLNDIFDEIVFKRDIKWGIKSGYLCDITCKRIDIGYDLSAVHTRMGDYAPGELAEAMEGTEDAIAQAYKEHAKGATLIFATNVRHAESIASKIDGAVVVTGKTKDRSGIIDAFTRREIPVLVNCMVFTEGTDIPLVETVIIARPTQSDSLYSQMVGRGVRLHPDKDKLVLIDCVGITGKRSLCTAPSLLGIDISTLPKSKQKTIEGELFDIPEKVERAADTPASWIKNVKIVDLWSKENNYDTHGINFFQMPDGTLKLSLPNKVKFEIQCPDELGKVYINHGTEYVDMQEAIDRLYTKLQSDFSGSEYIWNLNCAKKWGNNPASESQINLIKRKLKKKDEDIDYSALTKLEASQILNRILN